MTSSPLGFLFAMVAFGTSCAAPPSPAKATNQAEPAASPSTTPKSASTGVLKSEPYHWKSVVIRGGGFVTGLIYSKVSAGVLYARTDIGGAYRYDPKERSWIPITDFLGKVDGNLDARRLRPNSEHGSFVLKLRTIVYG